MIRDLAVPGQYHQLQERGFALPRNSGEGWAVRPRRTSHQRAWTHMGPCHVTNMLVGPRLRSCIRVPGAIRAPVASDELPTRDQHEFHSEADPSISIFRCHMPLGPALPHILFLSLHPLSYCRTRIHYAGSRLNSRRGRSYAPHAPSTCST
jgi:hypothetical protein